MNQTTYDIAILGGGINGAGIAADAASRGLRVLLIDKEDFGCATSSSSSKLIHGGLRYLEHMAFNLVRQSLKERDLLLKNAPHLVYPLQFIMPNDNKVRKAWLLKLGLFIYDRLSTGHLLPRSKSFQLSQKTKDNPLCLSYKKAFSYHDAAVDDARLVITNLIKAQEHGAHLYSRSTLKQVQRDPQRWTGSILTHDNLTIEFASKVFINATGPWAQTVSKDIFGLPSQHKIKKIKGSHIVVPKLYNHDKAYLLQHKDSRVIFAIPYHKQFTMIGTTDIPFDGDPMSTQCSAEEKKYLCQIASQYFHHPVMPKHIVHTWSGVRALVDDSKSGPSTLTREHQLELIGHKNSAALLNVLGGKITTYRSLSQEAVDLLKPFFPKMKPCSTKDAPLPGGDIPNRDLKTYQSKLYRQYPFISKSTLRRFVQQYGTRTSLVLGHCHHEQDLGKHLGHDLYECELEYLIKHEWALNAQDILWRRTKLGFYFNETQTQALETEIKTLLQNLTNHQMTG